MNKGVLIAALSLSVFPASAIAADWVYLDRTQDKKWALYGDKDSIRKTGQYVEAWFKKDHSRNPDTKTREAKELNRFNCSNRTYAFVAYVKYDASGDVIESDKYDYAEFEHVTPESMAEAMMEFACS